MPIEPFAEEGPNETLLQLDKEKKKWYLIPEESRFVNVKNIILFWIIMYSCLLYPIELQELELQEIEQNTQLKVDHM